MSALFVITRQAYLKLRRDKIFLPSIVIGLITILIAALISDWGIEEFAKILFDFGTFGFHLTGTVVAIFWGTKLISDSRQEGSIETELAAPVGRSSWLLGNFLGLTFGLLTMGLIFVLFWQCVWWYYGYGLFGAKHLTIFALLMLGWLVIAAVAIFFASITTSAVALFGSLCLWAVGLVSFPILQALSPKTPEFSRAIVSGIALFWNLKQFDLVDYATVEQFPESVEIFWRAGYGFFLIGFLVTLACIFFRNRDLSS